LSILILLKKQKIILNNIFILNDNIKNQGEFLIFKYMNNYKAEKFKIRSNANKNFIFYKFYKVSHKIG
jgi:hypothetical protein